MNEYGPTIPTPRCAAHDGAHSVYQGHCVAVGAQVPRPLAFRARPVICRECGADQDVVKLGTGRTMFLTAGTDQRHWHPAPPRVELDEDSLARAIVAASRATREQRYQERREREAHAAGVERLSFPEPAAIATTTAAAAADPPAPGSAPQDIPTATIWSPGPDDGCAGR